MKPLISVIVPVYNVEKYLEKCLDSILAQTLSDIEIIVIDDGSTDRSAEICDTYAQRDGRIKVLHKKNGGLSSARNAGLDIATGKYIALVDSDDWIADNMFEVLYDSIKEYKADIAQCECIKMKNDDTIVNPNLRIKKPTIHSAKEILERLHDKGCITYTVVWNKLYKAELFQGLRFPHGKYHEDEFFSYRMIHRAKRIVCCSNKLYFYRQRANSITGRKFNLTRLDAIEAFMQRKDFYKSIKLYDLYQKELIYLLKYIYRMYIQVKGRITDNKMILVELKRRYRSVFFELIRSNYRDKKLLCYAINCISPDIYSMEEKE